MADTSESDRIRAMQDEMRARHLSPEIRGKGKIIPRGGSMLPGDPLYEMLPNKDLLAAMKWLPREIYKFPPGMRSTGIQDDLSMSHSKIIRQFLLDSRKTQCDRQGRNRFIQILLNLVEIAKGKSPQAVAAATMLFERGFGKAKPSDEELDATRRSGFQLIYIEKMQGNIPTEEHQAPAPPQLPEFIEAEFGEPQ